MVYDVGADFFPDDPPGFYKVPFGYCDDSATRADLAAAGFDPIRHETLGIEKQVQDWTLFARGLVFGNPLVEEIQNRGTVTPDDAMAEIEAQLQARFGPAPALMPLQSTVYSARNPA